MLLHRIAVRLRCLTRPLPLRRSLGLGTAIPILGSALPLVRYLRSNLEYLMFCNQKNGLEDYNFYTIFLLRYQSLHNVYQH